MQVTRRHGQPWAVLAALAAQLASAMPARAQDEVEEETSDDEEAARRNPDLGKRRTGTPFGAQGQNRFFFDEPESQEELEETGYDGSLTLTNMLYRESSGLGSPAVANGMPPQNAAPFVRFFTDLRAQLDVEHISGGNWDFRLDFRGRYTPGVCRDVGTESNPVTNPCKRFQSGSLSGNEFQLRELYVRSGGDENRFAIGRQYVLELAATHFDGVKYERQLSEVWSFIAFAGLYPDRVSRDIRDDYPKIVDPTTQQASRALPLTGGGGASYRYESIYGSLGGVFIYPLTREVAVNSMGAGGGTGTLEKPRVFITGNGYWRASSFFDFFHFAILDATSSSGAGITNLTLGANLHPSQSFKAYAQVSRVDTETLNITAQSRLEDPGTAADQVQNNIAVQRIASESARVGVSSGFLQNRLELAVNGTLRQRDDITLRTNAGNAVVVPAARAADIQFQAVGRRLFLDTRLGLGLTRSFGLGGRNADRSETIVLRVDASREFGSDGTAEVEAYVNYLAANDETRVDVCNTAQLETCYGTSATRTISLGGTAFLRFADPWFLVAGLDLGLQRITVVDGMMAAVAQPSILLTTVFARLAYRF